jgi:hypothetical protein
MKYDDEMTLETTERQANYVKEQEVLGDGLGLVFADAFLRGMRDIGYKSPAWALSEMIDNSVQAQATKVEIVFGDLVSKRGGKQIRRLALVDNGVGMIPEMISYAVRWGGTDREDDRHGFGRYGYGLPSSAVSMAKLYSVYSKAPGGEWHRVTVDIYDLASVARDVDEVNARLKPVQAAPPEWVVAAAEHVDLKAADSGTVVTLDDLDRLRDLSGWKTAKSIKAQCMERFGTVYRHWLSDLQVYVDGDPVEAIDPLFLMEHGRYYDETEVMAEAVEARQFTVVSSRGKEGRVTLRASFLPPNFQSAEPRVFGKGSKTNKRLEIMQANNGLHICRDGREVECIQPPAKWTRFQTFDRNVKIEVDFDPELDEFFGITTAKQQITVNGDMWDRLRNRGKLASLISDIRKRFKKQVKALKVVNEEDLEEGEERPSETAMRQSEKYKASRRQPSEGKRRNAQKRLDREADKVSETERRKREDVIAEFEEQATKRPFRVSYVSVEEGPFYRPERLGEQKRLEINTSHPFYEKVYNVVPEARAALEVLLFVLSEGELDAEGESERFYKMARTAWSERLRHALEELKSDQSVFDAAAAAAAMAEFEESTTEEDG